MKAFDFGKFVTVCGYFDQNQLKSTSLFQNLKAQSCFESTSDFVSAQVC